MSSSLPQKRILICSTARGAYFEEQPFRVSRICVDDEVTGSREADYVIQNRFEQIAVIGAPGDRMYSALREDGFVRTVFRNKLTP